MAVIQGLDDFEKKLNRLSLAVQRKVLTKAVKQGAEIIRQSAEDKAPRLTGHLAERQIVSVIGSESNAFRTLVRIGPARDAYYGTFDEFGTAHQTPEPFLNPAFEENKERAEAYVADAFKQAVNEL